MDDPTGIYNWRRLDERLTTSGQPTEAELGGIKALGVETVVNLGLHSHPKALPDERASVTALGMAYIHQPVEFSAPTAADLATFCDLMDRLQGRAIHVHCIANYRVSAFLYRWRIDRLGWDQPRARVDLDAVWTPEGRWAAIVGDDAPDALK
jgi:protein tyrosine phosphatase (PTP) superfamily phosphohydrolase (DUF442 family)